jgi:hypothetical protein
MGMKVHLPRGRAIGSVLPLFITVRRTPAA